MILKKVGGNLLILTNFLITCAITQSVVPRAITQSVAPRAIAVSVKSGYNRLVLVILGGSDGQFSVPSITTK